MQRVRINQSKNINNDQKFFRVKQKRGIKVACSAYTLLLISLLVSKLSDSLLINPVPQVDTLLIPYKKTRYRLQENQFFCELR